MLKFLPLLTPFVVGLSGYFVWKAGHPFAGFLGLALGLVILVVLVRAWSPLQWFLWKARSRTAPRGPASRHR